jgi:hypothetical protein
VDRIASWTDARTYLAATYPDLGTLGGDGVQVPVPVKQGKKTVNVRPVGDWIEILATIGSARFVPPLTALARSFGMAMGALCVTQGNLALRQLLPLKDLPLAALADTITAIAQQCADGGSDG